MQAAHHLRTHPGPLGVFFRRVANRRGYNVAVVATARKLGVSAWHRLKTKEPYRYAQPQTGEDKLEQLRVTATGEQRKRGYPKGMPRPVTYGSGCTVSALWARSVSALRCRRPKSSRRCHWQNNAG